MYGPWLQMSWGHRGSTAVRIAPATVGVTAPITSAARGVTGGPVTGDNATTAAAPIATDTNPLIASSSTENGPTSILYPTPDPSKRSFAPVPRNRGSRGRAATRAGQRPRRAAVAAMSWMIESYTLSITSLTTAAGAPSGTSNRPVQVTRVRSGPSSSTSVVAR